jgi:dienelactone hydrolase
MRTLSLLFALALAGLATAQKTVEVSIPVNGATLQGTLYLPEGPGPFPAIVGVPGSGPVTRAEPLYTMDASLFVPQGIAVFVYDKRGNGKSTGSFNQANGIDVLVNDALACVKAMRKRPELDPKKIGLKGVSEGGWVVMKAGGRDSDLAFIVSLSGPGTDAIEQGVYQKVQILLAEGVSQTVVEKVNKLRRRVWTYYATGEGYSNLHTDYEAAKKESWFAQGKLDPNVPLPEPIQIAAPEYNFFRNAKFDAVKDISNIKVPVLAVFGAKDVLVPVLDSVAGWERGIEAGHLKDVTIRVFEKAGHGINVINTEFGLVGPALATFMQTQRFELSPEYVKYLNRWVHQRLISQATAKSESGDVTLITAGVVTVALIALVRPLARKWGKGSKSKFWLSARWLNPALIGPSELLDFR